MLHHLVVIFVYVCCTIGAKQPLVNLLSATPLQCSDRELGDLPEALISGRAGQLLPPSEWQRKSVFSFCVHTTGNPPSTLCCCCFPGQQEKGNTPLHIAAKAGQMFQAELLAVYGADPGALDSSGKTPIDYARWRWTCATFFFFDHSTWFSFTKKKKKILNQQ